MANFFGDVYGQIGSVWRKLSTAHKAVILIVSGAMVVGLAGVVYWSSSLEMGVLWGGLTAEDAGAIQARLEEQGVPYELTGGGNTIMVPRDRVYELRNQLAAAGLTRGDGQGMEIFDSAQLGMTEFLQNVNLTRALEGELARTISWLSQVSAARVFITRPKPTIFTELQNNPTAAVVLKLVPGRTLSAREVSGIAHIVSSAVEGLAPEDVKITDDKGRLLSKPPEEYEDQLAAGQLELKRSFETAMTRKVQDRLDTVVGVNKVSVVVNVDLDFQRQVMKEKKYSQPPEGKLVVKERTNTEDMTKSVPGQENGGGTSTQAKLDPSGVTPRASGQAEKTSSEDLEREYAINETDTDVTLSGAQVKRLSLAIMIDKSLEAQKDDIEGIVKQAVGFDEERNDSFTTAVIEFSAPELVDETEALESFEQREFIFTLIRYGIQGVSVAAVLLVLWVILRRAERKVAAAARVRSEPARALSQERSAKERERVKEEVLSAVQTDPVMASQILHDWLNEEEPDK